MSSLSWSSSRSVLSNYLQGQLTISSIFVLEGKAQGKGDNCFSWWKGQLFVMGKGKTVCQGKGDNCLSWWKGQLFVMGKGTTVCHGKRDNYLSWEKGKLFVKGKGTTICHGKRDNYLSWEKGQLFVMGKGTTVCHMKRDKYLQYKNRPRAWEHRLHCLYRSCIFTDTSFEMYSLSPVNKNV